MTIGNATVPREYVNDPYLADSGKPSTAELDRITAWEIYSHRDLVNLMGYVQVRWFFNSAFEYIPLDHSIFEVDTRRWPGNIALIMALSLNSVAWKNIFRGHLRVEGTDNDIYTFELPAFPEVPDDTDRHV